MDAIWRAAGGKLDEIEAGVDAAANDTFISMMDAAALSDMEAFLDIAPNKNRTLEVRRKLVASYFVGANHIGAPEIKELVRGYTGDTPEVKFSKGRIYVCISPPDESAFFSSDIIECLLRKIPAHLALSLSLSYKPDVQPAYAAAAPLGTTISCTVRLPGTIKPRAVSATAYAAGALNIELCLACRQLNLLLNRYREGDMIAVCCVSCHNCVACGNSGNNTVCHSCYGRIIYAPHNI